MANNFKFRIAAGNPPYNGTLKDFAGTTLATIFNHQADEYNVTDALIATAVGGIVLSLTDEDGKSGTKRYDKGTLRGLSKVIFGFSVANGNTSDHVAKITAGNSLGMNMTGVIFGTDIIETDAQLAAYTALGPFDEDAALPGIPEFYYDVTIHTANAQDTCNMIRVNFWLQRRGVLLNNGTTRTQFLDWSDAAMRPDGVTPTVRPDGNDITDTLYPSYASPNTLAYAKKTTTPALKRYVSFWNKCGIIGAGAVATSNAEGEMDTNYKFGGTEEEVAGSPRSHGDFHDASMAKFKARHSPDYDAISTSTLRSNIVAASSSSTLFKRWKRHLGLLIAEFEAALFDHWIAEIPGLTRTQGGQQDSGSWTDTLAYWRATFNINARIHPFSFLFKCNDDTNVSDETLRAMLDIGTSAAREAGGKFMWEMSPPNPYGSYLGEIDHGIELGLERGADFSIYTADNGIAGTVVTNGGLTDGMIPKNKQEFKIEDGHKILPTLTVNLSEVIEHGATGNDAYWRTQHAAYRTSQGLQAVNTRTIDDIGSSGGI